MFLVIKAGFAAGTITIIEINVRLAESANECQTSTVTTELVENKPPVDNNSLAANVNASKQAAKFLSSLG